eukprot:5320783-Amphidinium_carterae.1
MRYLSQKQKLQIEQRPHVIVPLLPDALLGVACSWDRVQDQAANTINTAAEQMVHPNGTKRTTGKSVTPTFERLTLLRGILVGYY